MHAPCGWLYDQLLTVGYSLLIRHACRACKRLLSVLSWCSHCVWRALGPTPAVYNHQPDCQRLPSSRQLAVHALTDGSTIGLDGVYSWLIRHARRTSKGLLSVLSWCNHCACRALGPTPAVYNH